MTARSVLEEEGFAVIPGVVSQVKCHIAAAFLENLGGDMAGTRRLLEAEWCATLVEMLRSSVQLSAVLHDLVAVHCVYFGKSSLKNWLAPAHQDICIPVQKQIAHPELRNWSEKEDSLYVQPPAWVLEALVAVRVHVDDSGHDNGPLRVVPGSHRLGCLPFSDCSLVRDAHGDVVCTSPRGGVVLMKPLVVHASSRSTSERPRRVLHYLFGPRELPFGLAWSRAI